MTGMLKTVKRIYNKYRALLSKRRKDRYIKAPEKLAEIINDSQPPDPEFAQFITDNLDDLI